MPPTETVERGSTRVAAVPEKHPPGPGVGPTPEAAGPETRSVDAGLQLGIPIVIALGALITVAWVGALVALAWWLIRTVLL
jgi:hypothetical protein